MERSGVLPTTQFGYRKGLGTCDVLLCVSHTLQSALESLQEARLVQIDFSAAFDRVNHVGILYKLCSVGIGGSVLSILTQFLSNRSHVMVDGCRSKLVNVVSGVPRGSVLGPLFFLMYTLELFSILLLLLKKIGSARPGEGDCHPISPKTPDPHYQPLEEKKRKGK